MIQLKAPLETPFIILFEQIIANYSYLQTPRCSWWYFKHRT